MANPSAFGGAGYGDNPFGTGGTFTLQAAIAVTENVVRLYFSQLPYLTGLLDPNDASQPSFYEFTPIASTGANGQPAQAVGAIFAQVGVDPNSIDVALDRSMSPFPALYQIMVTGVVENESGQPGVLIAPNPGIATFYGVYREIVPPQPEQLAPSRDIANPTTLESLQQATPIVPVNLTAATQLLGTYVVDSSGDYAADAGVVSYKKRVLRRGITKPGAFAFLPSSYGVGIPSYGKKLVSPVLRQKLSAAWQQQIYQEPETDSCSVTANTPIDTPQLCYFVVVATMKGGQQVNFRMPFPIS